MNEQVVEPKSYSAYLKYTFSFFNTVSIFGLFSMFIGSGESKPLERRDAHDIQDTSNTSLVNATVKGFEIARADFSAVPNVTAYDVAVQGNYDYVASGLAGIQVVDWRIPNSSPVANYGTGGFARQIDIDVISQTAWVAADTAGIFAFDISNPPNVVPKGNYSFPYPATKLRISKDKLFVANNNNPSLAVLNSTDPLLGSVIGGTVTYSESRAVFDIFPMGNEAIIAYPGIGTGIVDASSFPKVLKLSFALQNNAKATDTFVIKNYSLVASDKGLHVVDISDPVKPQLLVPNYYTNLGQASGVFAVNDTAYVGSNQGLYRVNYTNSLDVPKLILSGDVTAVFVNNNNTIAYIADRVAGLQLVNMTNSASPVPLGNYTFADTAKDVVLDSTGRIAYVAAGLAGLQVVDVRDPNNLKLFGNLINSKGQGNAQAVAVRDNIVCVADGQNGLDVVDVSDPNNPKLLGSYATSNAVGVSIVDQTVYLTDAMDGLYVFDISRFGVPELLGKYSDNTDLGVLNGLSVANNRTYIASDIGLKIVDAPLWKCRISKPTAPMQVAAFNNNLYMASFQKDLYYVNITDRINPTDSVIVYKLKDFVRDMVISKDYLFIAEGKSGIEILNIHNPLNPLLVGQIKKGLSYARGLKLVGNNLHVADDAGGLVVFQIDIQPLIQSNQLIAYPNQPQIFKLNNLNVVDPDNLPSELIFTITNLQNGNFQLVSNNANISSFTLDDIINGRIQFLANDGGVPDYLVNVTDRLLWDGLYKPVVFYNQPPILVNKTLQVRQGEPLSITTSEIGAKPVDNINIPPYNMTAVTYTVDQINNAYFAFSQNLSVVRNNFTQQDIVDGIVRLIPDGTNNAPSINISLSNGAITISSQLLNIAFEGVPQPPKLKNYTLFLKEGQSTIITTDQLFADDPDTTNNSLLSFDVNQIGFGRFSRLNSTVILGRFTQQDVMNRNIQFISTGNNGGVPSYLVSVTDDTKLKDGFISGVVIFDPLPKLIQNTLTIGPGESRFMTSAELEAVIFIGVNNSKVKYVPERNETLIFKIYDLSNAWFEDIQNPGIHITSFSQQQVMEGNKIKIIHNVSSNLGPEYVVSVLAQYTATPNQTAKVSFKKQQAANNIPGIAGGVVGGVLGFAAIAGISIFAGKTWYDLQTRKKHQLARYLREHLGLSEFNNFNSKEGQAFVEIVDQQLAPELKKQNYDVSKMSDNDIENLARDLADVMKSKGYLLSGNNSTFWRQPTLDLNALTNNIPAIVEEMLNQTQKQITNTVWLEKSI